MASAGITVYNDDNNKLIINQTYKNLMLKRKIKLTDLKIVEIDREDVLLLELKENEILAAVGGMTKNNNMLIIQDYDYNAKQIQFRGIEYSGDEDTDDEILEVEDFKSAYPEVYVYVFGIDTNATAPHGIGLQIFNADGDCVFSSDKKYMRVRHFGPTGYVLPDSESKYAICQIGASVAYSTTKGYFGDWTSEISFPAIIDGKIQVRTLSLNGSLGGPGDGDSWYYDAFNYIVLDVTNC
ncbi:MAG: hypothetical protein ACLTJQ_07095 [Dialister invisus]|uniref:hypothetical protein n=1 Tax=Dialister invisus TaxID=218538 RepID=UPI0039969362